MTIELVWDSHCPNVEATRSHLRQALARVGLPDEWQEWNRADANAPPHARRYGSPTVLVDGEDVGGAGTTGEANCCRVYADTEGRLAGVPSVEAIASVLERRMGVAAAGGRGGRWALLATVPAMGISLLPVVICPACLPAYAGLLASLGVGFLGNATYLMPLTVLFLIAALVALVFRARSRRGWGPFALGASGAAAIVIGKFVLASSLVTYAGPALLIGASVWNSWPRRAAKDVSCDACAPAGTPHTHGRTEVRRSEP